MNVARLLKNSKSEIKMSSPKLETPAFAEAPARRTSTLAGGASRRQAKL
jgi:hypothetical protein